jgi:hypothetical protein
VKGPPLDNLWAIFRGAIPIMIGMRRITGIRKNTFFLPDIGSLNKLNLSLLQSNFNAKIQNVFLRS